MNSIEPLSRDGLVLVSWMTVTYGSLLLMLGLLWTVSLAGFAWARTRLRTAARVATATSMAFTFSVTLLAERHLSQGELSLARSVPIALLAATVAGAAVFGFLRLPRRLVVLLTPVGLVGMAVAGGVEHKSFFYLGLEPDREASAYVETRRALPTVTSEPSNRLVVIGLDGLSPSRVDRLIKQGELPNLAKIYRLGAHGELATLTPTFSPILWTTVATGKMPGKHGVFNSWSLPGLSVPVQTYPVHIGITRLFYSMEGLGLFGNDLLTNSLRRTKAIWNIVSDAGGRVAIVQWWPSWPVEPINGVVVSDRYWPALKNRNARLAGDDVVYPGALFEALGGLVVNPDSLTRTELRRFLPRAQADIDEMSATAEREKGVHEILIEHYARDRTFTAISKDLLERSEYDLLAVYFKGVDAASHAAGEYVYDKGTRVIPERLKPYAGLVDEYYRYTDEILGDILAAAGPDVNVMICSDHGFTWLPDGTFNHRDAAPPGVFALYGPDAAVAKEVSGAHLVDLAPTMLHLLGLPVGLDMDGRVLGEALAGAVGDSLVRYIPSHDTESRRGQASESALDDTVREELRALGYIE